MSGILPLMGHAQMDTLTIPSIEVNASRIKKFGFSQIIQQDSIDQLTENNLAQVLSEKSGIYFKTYGQGSLASPSSRGAGFGHTNIIWNGFNLQHPMLGGLDFSLIAPCLFDGIEIQQNGVSSLFGSGTIGGGIHLNNEGDFGKGLHTQFNLGVGAFGEERISSKLTYSTRKWSSDLIAVGRNLDNDFDYINNRGEQPTQSSAQLKQSAIGQNNHLLIGKNQLLQTHLWVAQTDRKIPPSEVENNTNATQLDESFRFGVHYQNHFKNFLFKSRLGYIREHILFENDLINPSDSRTHRWIAEAELEGDFNEKIKWNIGLHQNYNKVQSSVYDKQKERQEVAAFASLRYDLFDGKTTFIGSTRQAMVEREQIPFIWSFAAQHLLSKSTSTQFTFAKNYNLPTFNDLFWPSVGNPDLKPESGINMDWNLQFKQKIKFVQVTSQLSLFQNIIDNWILWSPNELGQWTPDNQRKVQTRGIEFQAGLQHKNSWFSWQWKGIYSFTDAKVREVYNLNSQAINQQLIYVPFHQLKNTFRFTFRPISIQYQHIYTSKVYTTTDNSSSLPAYHLGNLQVSYIAPVWKKDWYIYLKINNLWNIDYETIPFRPLPLRHLQGGIKFAF